jgi:hypothetical protein
MERDDSSAIAYVLLGEGENMFPGCQKNDIIFAMFGIDFGALRDSACRRTTDFAGGGSLL